jgi:AhpD family alkylhydroperoxidase
MIRSTITKGQEEMSHARKEYKDFMSLTPDAYAAVLALSQIAGKAGMDKQLLELIKLRASQINGCAFCVQYHILEGEKLGVSADKLNLVVVWREAPQFSPRERAALAWTEALTLLSEGVSDEIYAQASAEFSEKELAYLTSAVAAINVWNRFGAAFRWTPPARKPAVGAAAS